jgi:hypothetical protein
MPALNISLDADGLFAGVPKDKLAITEESIDVGVLAGGMGSGKPSVVIGMHLPHDGGTVVGQTSMALFLTAALAMYTKFGDAGTDIEVRVK